MPEKTENIIDKRQAFLLLFTLQLILNSSDKVNELSQIIKSEEAPKISKERAEKQLPANRIQKPAEKQPSPKRVQKPAGPVREEDRMIKSVLSRAPPQTGGRPNGIKAVKPVNIKVPRREIIQGQQINQGKVLRMPEPRLPPEFQFLRPTPTAKEIDLGKLNPLIYDRAVQTIECAGPDKPLIVTGAMGKKPTEISLDNGEIEDIIKRFSSASKIPAETGVYKVVVGRLIFSAVISDVIPSRFTIRKMALPRPAVPARGPTPVFMNRNPNYKLFFRKQ